MDYYVYFCAYLLCILFLMIETFETTYLFVFHVLPCLIFLFSQFDGTLMSQFDSLVNLDLRRNDISGIDIRFGKLYFHISLSVTCVR